MKAIAVFPVGLGRQHRRTFDSHRSGPGFGTIRMCGDSSRRKRSARLGRLGVLLAKHSPTQKPASHSEQNNHATSDTEQHASVGPGWLRGFLGDENVTQSQRGESITFAIFIVGV